MIKQDRSASPSLHRRNRWTILLLVVLLITQSLFLHPEQALAIGGFTITTTTPASNAQNVAFGTTIAMTFNIDLNTATATNSTIVINGSMSGVVSATFSYNVGTRTLTLTPSRIFMAGEVVSVNATSGVKSSSAASLQAHELQFTPGLLATRCVDGFSSSGASLPGIRDGAVAWGDYNNDGYADLALVGNNSSTLISKIYRSNGDGSFTDSGAVLPGLQYAAAAWGDYNNDGFLDLVISGWDSGYVARTKLYKNNGNGTFSDSGQALTGMFYSALAWGDYDGDGYLDLVVAGNNGSSMTILYHNNGNGTFSNSGQALTGLLFAGAAWGDYNNDGALDLVMTGSNSGNNRVTLVYQNDGSGTLNDNGLPLTGIAQGNPAWGDYNSDGKLDLLITGSSGNGGGTLTMKLYRNDGNNVFTEITGTGLPPMNSGTGVWGDYNNDGKPDILLAGETSGNTQIGRVYRNNGDGTFSNINAGLPGLAAGTAAWGDYDKDGSIDLVLVGQNNGPPYNLVAGVYHNDACGPNLGITKTVTPALATRGQPVSYTLTYSNSGTVASSSVLITDTIPAQLTGVSYQSSPALTTIGGSSYVWNVGSMPIGASGIITVNGTLNGSVALGTVFTNTATIKGSPIDIHPSNDSASAGALAAVLVTSTTPAANASGIATSATINATFNEAMNSGTIDASTMLSYGNMTGLLPGAFGYNIGTKKITFTPTNVYKSGEVVTVDMTSGIKDSTGSSLTPKLWQFVAGPVINNRCSGSFNDIGAGLLGLTLGNPAWGDYDKDGNIDLLVTGTNDGSTPVTKLYRNNGNGTFSEVSGTGLAGIYYDRAAWGDYDRDGDPDILMSGGGAGTKVYRNNGNGNFTPLTTNNIPDLFHGRVAWGDYDNDGKLDILLSGSNFGSPAAYVYHNNGNDTFTDINAGITAYNESALAWLDYDNDSKLDFIYAGSDNSSSGTIRLYHNNGNGTFTKVDAGLTGVRAGSIAVGDYDQDGKVDLLLMGSTSSGYTPISKIYHNNGNGSFTDIGAGLTGLLMGSANWVDYDNDGKLDAFVVGMTSTYYTDVSKLYHNNGNGTFSDSGLSLPATQDGQAAWGDYNNDGKLDLALTGQGTGFTNISKIYRNDDCVPDLKIVKSAPPTAPRGQLLTYTINYSNIGQLTSNNIVITDNVPAQLTGVSFQSTRTITPSGTYVWQAGSLAPGASGIITVTGTINPATALDTVITNTASLTGSPAESTTSNNSSTVTTQVKVEVIATNPLNHASGVPLTSPINATFSDAMTSGSMTNATVKLQGSTTGLIGGTLSYNAGSKQMTLTPSRALKTGEMARVTLTSGVQSSTGAALLPYQWEFTADPVVANRCVGRFFDVGAGLTGGYYSSAAWGDYDKDGNLDVVISGQDSSFANFTKLYRNTGSGFSLVAGTGLPNVYLASLSWGDYNNDGYPDLLITGYDNNFGPISRVYRNNGNGTFTDIVAGLNSVYYGQGAWGDYDNDGYLDLVVAGNGYSTLYHGNGTTFSDANAGLPAVWGGAVAWGDYDNDGDLDLALSGSTANSDASGATTRIYKNTSGSFSNSGTVMTGVWYGSLAWSDYDQDGRLDLASTGQTSVSSINSTKLYHNTAGGFVDSGVALPGVYLGTVAWGDYNNDGKPDLLVTGDNANTALTVLYRNTGSGLTSSGLSLPAFKNGGAAWGDYNNDGALDLIQIGYNSSFAPSTSIYRNEICAAELSITKTTSQPVAGHGQTVQYLLNYGNSGTLAASNVVITDTVPAQLTGVSFQSSRTITPTGTYVWQVGTLTIGASGTITVTGQVDAGVTAGTIFTNTASISIAPGEVTTSNNSSSAATRVSFTVSSTSPQANAFPVALNAPVTLTFSDDANTSTISSTSVILYGSMSGVFSTTTSYNAGTRTLTLTPAAAFKQGEIIWVRATAAIKSSGSVSLQPYQWEFTAGATGNSCIDSVSPISAGLPNVAANVIAWGDYNKDGYLDLLMAGGGVGKVYRNNGNGTFTDINAGLPAAYSAGAAWVDYNNDGYLDFVISGNALGPFTRIYRNNGNGNFTNMGASGIASNSYISSVAWGDYDNDGYLDLLFAGTDYNTSTKFTKLYHNNGNSTFSDSGISLTNVGGGSLNWADYDNDGNLDLLLTGQDNSSANITKLYHNNGNSTFSEVTGAGLPIVISGAAAWGDYNGDGRLDLLVSGYMGSSSSTRIYRNNGNGTFTDINAGLPGLQSSAVAWGDYNNDGKLDFVLSGETSVSTPPYAPITKIYENHGSGSFSDSGFTFTGLFYTALAWGDENGDGFLDLLTAGFYDGTYTPLTKLYRNSPCQPDLGITKSATPSQATPGQPIVYTLTYSNAGTLPASTVVITDIVPTEVMSPTFQSSPAVTTIGGNTYVWQVGTLAPGAGGVITVTGQVSSSLTFSSIFTNTATIHTSSFEVKQANNSSTVVSRVTFHIISTSPGTNAQSVSLTAPISAVFNADLNASTITSSTFTLRGSMSGVITGTLSYNAGTRTLLLTPSRPFKAGEVLRVSATSGIQSTLGTSLESYQWEFTAGTIENRCFGGLSDTGIVMPRIAFGTAAWGDYDNDGLPDLLLAGTLQSGTIATRIYHNNGDGSFSTVSAGLPGVTGGAAAWGDYDNDGKLDLVLIGSSSSGSIAKIYHNTGSGFADSGISLQGLASGAAAWGDYDNDGNLDLVLSGQDSSNSTVFTKLYHNNGNGSFSTVSAGFANVYSAALAWGDYNNDGSLDLLVAGNTVSSGSTGITKIYKNNGNSTFSDSGISLQGLYSGAAAWGDYDGDGNLDLVLSGSNSAYAPVTKLYHNNGAGTLSDSGVALANLSGSAAAWGDYDNDGKLDLVLSGSNSVPITKLYHNNGSGSFSGSSSGLPQASYGALAWGDYNGDNRLELAIFGYKNNAEYVGSLYRTNDCADLGIKKSVTPVQLMPGQPIAYTLVYSNTGAGIATAVLITDTLPAQLTSLNYTSSGPALTTIGSSPYVWSAGSLAPGASGVITVTGIVSPNLSADQSIPNTASISNSSIETSYANNSSGATVGVVVPRARFSGTSYQVGEGGGSATITVTLDVANPNAAVTVDYATANGTALDGSDYTAEHATLTIPAGQTSATFTIPIIDDALSEPTETILLSLSGPGGAALGSPATATLSIIDDDPSVVVPHVNFSGTSYQVGEGGGSATITVTLDVANPNAAVTVDYATANGTALDGSDYTGTLATLTIPAGQTSATFTIPIIDDALSEPTETILLNLSGPSGAALGSQASATLSIIDDELSTTYLIYLPIVSRS